MSKEKYNYSPTEDRLLKIIPKDGSRIDTEKILKRFYARRELPLHGRIYITNALRALMRKAQLNREPFKIKRTEGTKPLEFWVE